MGYGGDLGAAHQALVAVLQGAHHGCLVALLLVALLLVLLRGWWDGGLGLLQLLLVEGELDGVGGRLGPQVVHARLQTLWGGGGGYYRLRK